MDRKQLMKTFLPLAFPLMMQSMMTSVISATDALMLSALGQNAMSAVTLAGQFIQIFNFFIIALCVGSTALLAQYWGNKDLDSARKVMDIALQLSLIGGILFGLAALVVPHGIIHIFTDDSELIDIGAAYLRVCAPSLLFMSFSQVYMNFMKNIGKAKQSSIIGSLAVALNIGLDAMFIYGLFGLPTMGATGAGLATTITRAAEFVCILFAALQQKQIPLRIRDLLMPYVSMMRKFLRYTLPSITQSVTWMVASSLCMAILGHQGSDVVAASSITMIVFNIVSGIVNGYASAAGITAGHMLGRGELKQAKAAGDQLMLLVLGISAAVGTIVALLSAPICRLYTNMTPEALQFLKIMLWFAGFRCIGKYINTTLAMGLFTAGGDIQYLLKLDIINMWGVVLPLGLLAAYAFHLPPMAVYVVLNLDEYYKLYFMVAHYRKYKWVKNLTKKEWAEPGRYDNQMRKVIFANLPMGIIVIGANGRITMSNEESARILGTTVDELDGSSFAQAFLENAGSDEFFDTVLDAVQDKQATHDFTVNHQDTKLHVTTSFMEDEEYKMGVCLTLQVVK